MEVPHRGAAGSSINFNKHRQGHATVVMCQTLSMVRLCLSFEHARDGQVTVSVGDFEKKIPSNSMRETGHDALDQSPGTHLGFGVIGLPIRKAHRGRDAVSRMQDDRAGWGEVL